MCRYLLDLGESMENITWSAGLCICLIFQKTIQLTPYLKMMDSSRSLTKMIKSVKSIHVFKIYLLFDSALSGSPA